MVADGRKRLLRWLGVSVVPAFLVLGAWLVFAPTPAAAVAPPPFVPFASVCAGPGDASTSAAVVVDLGDGDVRRACVRLDAASITGLEALQRGGMTPAVRGFSGMGVAVCALCGTGCGTGNDCLTCKAPKYWGYFRAEPGAGEFTYSSVGAGATAVRPGGVEIWRWGTQAATSTPANPPTSAPPATVPSPSPPSAPAAAGAPASATGAPVPKAGAGAAVPGPTTAPVASAVSPASVTAPATDAASVAGTDAAATTAEPGTAADGAEGAETLASTALGARVDTRARPTAPGIPATVVVAGIVAALGAAAAATSLLRRRRRAATVAADAIVAPSPDGPTAGPSR